MDTETPPQRPKRSWAGVLLLAIPVAMFWAVYVKVVWNDGRLFVAETDGWLALVALAAALPLIRHVIRS